MSELPQIALCGKTGVGKTHVSNYLKEQYGYTICSPGKACREIAQRLFGTEDKTVLNQINDAMRAIEPNVWLRVALAEVQNNIPIVIDGMRFVSNYRYLKKRNFVLVNITADEAVRRKRLVDREQIFSFETDNVHASEIELIHSKFDYYVENSSDSSTLLYRAIDNLVMREQTPRST